MERSNYLNKNALASGAAALIAVAIGANNFELLPFMLVIAGLTWFSAVRDMIAAGELEDEAEERVSR